MKDSAPQIASPAPRIANPASTGQHTTAHRGEDRRASRWYLHHCRLLAYPWPSVAEIYGMDKAYELIDDNVIIVGSLQVRCRALSKVITVGFVDFRRTAQHEVLTGRRSTSCKESNVIPTVAWQW